MKILYGHSFILKEHKDRIVLTTHKKLPISLNSNNDVYFFKNELYLPSKNQAEKNAPLYEKLKAQGKIFYRKDVSNYNKLISLLSSISRNINIAEEVRNFVSNLLKLELYMKSKMKFIVMQKLTIAIEKLIF